MVKEATLHRTLPAFCEHLLLVIWWFFAPHRPSSTSCKREKSEHLGPSSLVMWSSIFQSLPRILLNSNHLSNQSAIVCFLNSLPPEVCNGGISDKLQCQRLQVVSGGTFPRVLVVAVSKCIRYHEILIRTYHEIHGIYWILNNIDMCIDYCNMISTHIIIIYMYIYQFYQCFYLLHGIPSSYNRVAQELDLKMMQTHCGIRRDSADQISTFGILNLYC